MMMMMMMNIYMMYGILKIWLVWLVLYIFLDGGRFGMRKNNERMLACSLSLLLETHTLEPTSGR